MRNRWGLILIQVLIAAVNAMATPAAAGGRFYVSLGTSLSVGIQPTPSGNNHRTPVGYADQLQAALQATMPDLKLRKLGCPGETSVTMIVGGICGYGQGSQLAQAVAFLQQHAGAIALITVDIGANDVIPCVSDPDPAGCVNDAGLTVFGSLVSHILPALQAAAPGVQIVGMNYYNPFVAVYFTDPVQANGSVLLLGGFNAFLAAAYGSLGIPVADVAGEFHSNDFPLTGPLPLPVALICQWTWMCVPPPQGPNIHANAIGYGVIATAFLDVLSP